jgi:hypothetical protein
MMSGVRSLGNTFSTSSAIPAKRSKRSSNKSGGLRIRTARSRSARDAITPTTRGRRLVE